MSAESMADLSKVDFEETGNSDNEDNISNHSESIGGEEGYCITFSDEQRELSFKMWLDCMYRGEIESVRQLSLQNKELILYEDPFFGNRSLHYAVRIQSQELISFLIENGADVNSQNYEGYTPYHIAVMMNDREIEKLLLTKYGANPNIRDFSGHVHKFSLVDIAKNGSILKVPEEDYDSSGGENLSEDSLDRKRRTRRKSSFLSHIFGRKEERKKK